MDRRRFLRASAGIVAAPLALGLTRIARAETTIPQVPLDGTPTPIGTPGSGRTIYEGDEGDLWYAPWNFGNELIDVGGSVVQRFVGTEGKGYKLSDDGVIVRNVFLLKGYGGRFFVGTNQDIGYLASAKALRVRGTYGGTASPDIDSFPIVLAISIEKGA